MRASTLLRVFVGLELTAAAASVFALLWLEDKLPIVLQRWLLEEYDREWTALEWGATIVGVVALVVWIVSCVGLLMLRKWAARGYFFSVVLLLLINLLLPPRVEHQVAAGLGDLTLILAGIVIGLAFWSDALKPPQSDVRSDAPTPITAPDPSSPSSPA